MNKAGTFASTSQEQTFRTRALRVRPAQAIPVAAVLALTVGSLVVRPIPRLLWNISPSSPTGLYVVRRAQGIHVGDMIVAWAPPAVRRLADRRHYLPMSVPLIKRVAAVNGDQVCASSGSILVNGRTLAVRRRRDPGGRILPWWTGCKQLRRGELFLLSPDKPLAFDGRYFGLTRANEIIGKARLIWAG